MEDEGYSWPESLMPIEEYMPVLYRLGFIEVLRLVEIYEFVHYCMGMHCTIWDHRVQNGLT